jgi:hypothetical protein
LNHFHEGEGEDDDEDEERDREITDGNERDIDAFRNNLATAEGLHPKYHCKFPIYINCSSGRSLVI